VALRDMDGGYGKPVDIWALGVVLYILLSGIHPFQIEDEEQMLNNIQVGKFKWLGRNWYPLCSVSFSLLPSFFAIYLCFCYFVFLSQRIDLMS
jgi:serine/threonine protein kinase